MATNIIPPDSPPDSDQAADVIRDKLARIYATEPEATTEASEAAIATVRSKHQEFMYRLSMSGKDLATIQTRWHEYYQALPAHEQHEVWQEFYDSQALLNQQAPKKPDAAQHLAEHKHQVVRKERAKKPAVPAPKIRDVRSKEQIQAVIRDKVTAGGKLQLRHHIQSLLFGLGIGAVVIFIFLFSFFNEVLIAPFIQPSRAVADTPLIVNAGSVAPTADPEVIIPKINVEIPVNYTETSTDENAIENDLEGGIVHYPTTVMPGQTGNAAFFGHSSNNIFNKGKYKFAFVLLHTLVPGDTFYLTYQGKVYAYKVITKTVVDPSDVSVLDAVPGQTATATLITCDPPGTSLRRLIIVGQQISPDPSTNTAATTTTTVSSTHNRPVALPGNGPMLLTRIWRTAAGKAVITVVVVGGLAIGMRQVNKRRLG